MVNSAIRRLWYSSLVILNILTNGILLYFCLGDSQCWAELYRAKWWIINAIMSINLYLEAVFSCFLQILACTCTLYPCVCRLGSCIFHRVIFFTFSEPVTYAFLHRLLSREECSYIVRSSLFSVSCHETGKPSAVICTPLFLPFPFSAITVTFLYVRYPLNFQNGMDHCDCHF